MADTNNDSDANPAGLGTESLSRLVELARQELRDRGYSDEAIDMLLHRDRAPEPNV